MEDEIECIGICEPDPDNAYCTGCGRPWGENGNATAEPPQAVTPAQNILDDES